MHDTVLGRHSVVGALSTLRLTLYLTVCVLFMLGKEGEGRAGSIQGV